MNNPTFQHRHYVWIAARVRDWTYSLNDVDRQTVIDAVTDSLATTNPRFDRDRFIAAAHGRPITGRDKP